MFSLKSFQWISLAALVAVVVLAGYAATSVLPAAAKNEKKVLEFDVAEDMSRFVFDQAPVFEDGLPAHGNSFITEGYIYPKGTLNGTNGVLVNDDGTVEPEFPDEVLGKWVCRGWFIGDAAHAESGPWVITTQVYNFGEEYGNVTIVTDGYEVADVGVPVDRAITGGTGQYSKARGQASQVFLGFNASEGVNLSFTLEIEK